MVLKRLNQSKTSSYTSQEKVLRVGWLIDGRGGPLLRDMVIRLGGGRIISINPWQPRGQPLTKDLSHATVLPPLMDAHVHLVFSGTLDTQKRSEQLQQTPAQAQAAILRHLNDCLRHGVIAVRDGGDRNGNVLRCKKQNLFGPGAPVHVAATCWAWHAQGRYGKMIGRSPSEGVSPSTAVQDHLEGIDHLKVLQSGLNSIDCLGHQGRPQFSTQDLDCMVKTAHDAHRPVMVHANGDVAVRMAVAAGCDSIEHGYFMGEDNLRRIADRAIFWVPTVIPMAALSKATNLTTIQRDVASRTVDHQLAQIRSAHQAGVAIALGTDAGSQGVEHGTAVRHELKLLMSAGLSLEAAVRCATANIARLMGLEDRGELTPGRRADFLIVTGAPEKILDGTAGNCMICLGGVFSAVS